MGEVYAIPMNTAASELGQAKRTYQIAAADEDHSLPNVAANNFLKSAL